MKTLLSLSLVVLFASNVFAQTATQESTDQKKEQTTKQKAEPAATETAAKIPAALNFKMKSISGKEVNLSDYNGKVVVFVNTASKCGLTPQYKGLETLHDKYGDQGLAIVGFPCNQFGGQEPGTEAEIKTFCEKNYGVSFDMMSKINVNGDDQCDLYKHLNNLETKPKGKGNVKWNFEKFVLNKKGEVIGRYGSRVKPGSDEFVKVIESELSK